MTDTTDTQTADQIPPMSDRDRLADKLAECAYEGMSARETADALLEAGVRPPARVISDLAELDELPVGSVVWTGYDRIVRRVSDRHAESTGRDFLTAWRAIPLPVTVLHIPTQEGQADA